MHCTEYGAHRCAWRRSRLSSRQSGSVHASSRLRSNVQHNMQHLSRQLPATCSRQHQQRKRRAACAPSQPRPLCTGSHCSAPDPLGRLRYDRLAACCVTTLTSACRLVLLQQVIVTSEAESLALVYKVCSRLCVRALVRACVHGCDGDCVEMRCASLECVLSALASCTTRRHVADARVPARVLHR